MLEALRPLVGGGGRGGDGRSPVVVLHETQLPCFVDQLILPVSKGHDSPSILITV